MDSTRPCQKSSVHARAKTEKVTFNEGDPKVAPFFEFVAI